MQGWLCSPVQHPSQYPPTSSRQVLLSNFLIQEKPEGVGKISIRANFQQPSSPVSTSAEGWTPRGMAGVQKRREEKQQRVCECLRASGTRWRSFSGAKRKIWDCKRASEAPSESSSLQENFYGESSRTNRKLRSNFI